jgi:ABC-type Fe3+ transport system substrate-binding protein
MFRTWVTAVAASTLLFGALLSGARAGAAELPKSTHANLAALHLDASFMDGLDKELAVPQAWIDGAKKEGNLRITGSWDNDQFQKLAQPFNERYPFIKINYTRGDLTLRAVRPLVALKEGRIISDIVTGLGDYVNEYMAIGGFETTSTFPAYDAVAPDLKQKDGLWIGAKLRYWCMSYNTSALKKADLPKTWDDLFTDPAMRGGKLGLANEAQLWLLPLAGPKGEAWMTSAIARLFNDVKPQRRKESVNALQGLVIAGEINAALPAADYRVAQYVAKGAPIAWHCPEPVPSAISEMALIKGSPNTNAAHLFGNWLISKEGQVAQYVADGATPIHRGMQSKEFLAFPQEIENKPVAFLASERYGVESKVMLDAWNPLWNRAQ